MAIYCQQDQDRNLRTFGQGESEDRVYVHLVRSLCHKIDGFVKRTDSTFCKNIGSFFDSLNRIRCYHSPSSACLPSSAQQKSPTRKITTLKSTAKVYAKTRNPMSRMLSLVISRVGGIVVYIRVPHHLEQKKKKDLNAISRFAPSLGGEHKLNLVTQKNHDVSRFNSSRSTRSSGV